MKYHIALKFLAVLLCTCFLLTAAAAGLGIVALAGTGLYSATMQEVQLDRMHYMMYHQAEYLVMTHLLAELEQMPQAHAQEYAWSYYTPQLRGNEDLWFYTIADESGKRVDQRYDPVASLNATKTEFSITVQYPVVRHVYTYDSMTGQIETEHHNTTTPTEMPDHTEATADPSILTEPSEAATAPVSADSLYWENWRYCEDTTVTEYALEICRSPVYTVTFYLLPGAYESEPAWAWDMLEMLYLYRYDLIAVLGVALLLFAITYVYLCCAAGRKPKSDEVRPGGLNRIPLDLYGGAVALAVACLAVGCWELARWQLDAFDPAWLLMAAIGGMAFVGCLLIVAFLFAFAAQVKVPGAWWLRHSVVGAVLILCFKAIRWVLRGVKKAILWLWAKTPTGARKGVGLVKQLFGGIWKIVLALWAFGIKTVKECCKLLGRFCKALWRGIHRFVQLLPMTWQWLLTAFVLMGVIAFVALPYQPTFVVLLGVGFCTAIVLYGTHCFGTLLESTRRMSKGDLDTKVDDRLLIGSFKDFAGHLNALADVAVEAARKQMKSERMKAELITNVSHDIKTPLTSIINYVDLMQKAESPEEAEEYLEVLSRQSQRMKKLLEDLLEMSKASTGNLPVNLARVDAVETVNQALGEFSEKLEQAQLTPVFQPPQGAVDMLADGKLAWRVLSNLLSNAVKYAMPGTRLYIDLVQLEDRVLISLKNISREQLNVSTEELLERFVRGDASRNTEGSGLGLNIARSLMELQKGQLQLLVDGDLFKVTLVFQAE